MVKCELCPIQDYYTNKCYTDSVRREKCPLAQLLGEEEDIKPPKTGYKLERCFFTPGEPWVWALPKSAIPLSVSHAEDGSGQYLWIAVPVMESPNA